ncbi:glycosyltransferase family 4 protein [Lutibacter sp.]|uniref:glycosyltransferase family 4 protein n=1 Tax=Lutibacter sp. TaxID=1925666 RepID=UPI0025C3B5E9|nr:glycosyltransferase family 4 protein [Lutibacter sp.]MCF6167809.1 glycosyltransferase family 4 protein [Lutibacter sp.]
MRIGMILDKTFPPDPRVENEATSLIEKGHEVFLFCLKYSNTLPDEVLKGIQVKRYKSNRLTYKLSALAYTIPLYTLIMSKKIHHFLITNKIEVIHIHDIQIAEAVFKANKSINLKVVLDLHENRPEIMKFYPHLKSFLGKILISLKRWKQKEEEFIKKATTLIVVTEESKNEIVNRVGKLSKEIVVVPNTVHRNYYNEAVIKQEILEKYKDNFVLLYIGDTGLRRGLQTAIESISVLKETIKNLKLVVVGSNTSDTILKEQVKELNIQNFVDFEGWKNENLLPSYILASSICISPLHRNLHHDTTYANKLSQYMSIGKPLLVSNAIAQVNLIKKATSGLIHREQDSEDFTMKVLQLYTDKKLRENLGSNGVQFITEEFSWEKTSKNLIDLYANLNL